MANEWLDFEDEKREKGYRSIELTEKNIKENKGKTIVYLLKRDIDHVRGFAFPRYGRIDRKWYSKLLLNEGQESIDLRDVVEAGIKIQEDNP